MPRNSTGTASPPAGNPVTTGSPISSSTHNSTVSDIYTELTDSASRSGKGGFLAAIKAIAGSVLTPGVTWNDETGMGWYRSGAGDSRFAIGGADIVKIVSTGIHAVVHGALTATSAILKGSVADGAAAVGTILDNSVTLANATAKTVSVRNNGTEKAYFDKDGNLFSDGVHTATLNAPLSLTAEENDGATAVAFVLNNNQALSTAGAKLLSLSNNGTEKTYFDKDGSLFVGGSEVPTKASGAIAWAWANLTTGAAGAVTVNRGYNVASASWATTSLDVTMTTGTNDAYGSVVATWGNGVGKILIGLRTGSVMTFRLQQCDTAGTLQNWASGQIVNVTLFYKT